LPELTQQTVIWISLFQIGKLGEVSVFSFLTTLIRWTMLATLLPLLLALKVEPIGSRAGPVATSHSRRDAVAVSLLGSIALVQPVFAVSNPWDKGPVEGLKAESTCKPKGTCACNCMPDGFGAPCIERALVALSAH